MIFCNNYYFLPIGFKEVLPSHFDMADSKISDILKNNSETPSLLRNLVLARWDSVTGPTIVRAWPELISGGTESPNESPLRTSSEGLTVDMARFISRNCLTAEVIWLFVRKSFLFSTIFFQVANSVSFGNKINSRIFTVPELGLVTYAIVFACSPCMKPKVKSRAVSTVSTASSVIRQFSQMGSEELFTWFFLFDTAITRVIEFRSLLEEHILTRYLYLLRVALTKEPPSLIELHGNLPDNLSNVLDNHAEAYKKLFTTISSCIFLPGIRFTSTVFAVNSEIIGESREDSAEAGPPFLSHGSEENIFLRKAITSFLTCGGRALVIGHSSKAVNGLVYTLAMFLPLHCRRLCRLAAARPNESFIPGFFLQGLVGAPYPTGTELLLSHHPLTIINSHARTVCMTATPMRHRIAATAFSSARVRDAWQGVTEDGETASLAELPLSDNIPDESIVGDFLLKVSIIFANI